MTFTIDAEIHDTAKPTKGRVLQSLRSAYIDKTHHVQEQAAHLAHSVNAWYALSRAVYVTLYGELPPIVERPIFEKKIPAKKFETGTIQCGNIDATYTKFFPLGTNGTIIMALGHGAVTYDYIKEIKDLNAAGFNVAVLELPIPENNEYFADGTRIDVGYEQIISQALLSPDSPLYAKIPSFHSVNLITHSAGGQAFERVIKKDPTKAEFAAQRFDEVFHTGLILDTSGSSQRFNPAFSALYNFYSNHPKVRNFVIGDAPPDRSWLSNNLGLKTDQYFFNPTNPTHGQAHCLKQSGIELVEAVVARKMELEEQGEQTQYNTHFIDPFFALKRTIIMGDKDPSACPKTAEFYADLIGARFKILPNIEHNPLSESAEFLNMVTDIISNEQPAEYLNMIEGFARQQHRPALSFMDSSPLAMTQEEEESDYLQAATAALPVRALHAS